MRRKITVVGAGNVGATTAQRLAERDYADRLPGAVELQVLELKLEGNRRNRAQRRVIDERRVRVERRRRRVRRGCPGRLGADLGPAAASAGRDLVRRRGASRRRG